MKLEKFEELAAEFIKENDLSDKNASSLFVVQLQSGWKDKRLSFQTAGPHRFIFEVAATNWDELFDTAFRVLKGYVKQTRERKPKENPDSEPTSNPEE